MTEKGHALNILANYADEDTTLAENFEKNCRRVMWHLFDNQETWLHMYGELGERSNPKLKDKVTTVSTLLYLDEKEQANYSALDYIYQLCREQMWLEVHCMAEAIIARYYLDEVDLPDSIKNFYMEEYDCDTWEEVENIWRERATKAGISQYRFEKPDWLKNKD
jgi:hypothetical protein